MRDPKTNCPKCGQKVHRVDGEYQRHYRKSELCTMSCRELVEEAAPPRA